jgi:hypothetical protein
MAEGEQPESNLLRVAQSGCGYSGGLDPFESGSGGIAQSGRVAGFGFGKEMLRNIGPMANAPGLVPLHLNPASAPLCLSGAIVKFVASRGAP